MTNRKAIAVEGAPKAIGPYSQAVAAGGLLFLSGQIALDPETGQLVGTSAAEQSARCLENLRAVLAGAGCRPSDVVRATLFLVDLADFVEVNRVYGEFFGAEPPARTTVQAAALPRGARVEIDAIALVPVPRPGAG